MYLIQQGPTFMTSTKKYQFFSTFSIQENEQYVYCLKTIESTNTCQMSRPLPIPLSSGCHKRMALWLKLNVNVI